MRATISMSVLSKLGNILFSSSWFPGECAIFFFNCCCCFVSQRLLGIQLLYID